MTPAHPDKRFQTASQVGAARTRVLIVDDSALMRTVLAGIVGADAGLQVVGTVGDAVAARDAIAALSPDVLTLDVEMPGIDGLRFLEELMRTRPMPVVMISSVTEQGSDIALRALELGAVDVVAKPRAERGKSMQQYAEEICDKIKAAALARTVPMPAGGPDPDVPGATLPGGALTGKLIFIGASTGGTEAIREVLTRLPAQSPGVLIVQHMPEMFTGSFARRLDGLCRLHVKEAEDGEPVRPGVAYIAPGHSHLRVRRVPGGFACVLSREEPVNRHRPSVDVLFHSAAKVVGPDAVGVILTGMGKDGAQGMLDMRRAGAWTIAQDERSCVVWGMPREAAAIGAVQEVSSLKDVAARVLMGLRGAERRPAGV